MTLADLNTCDRSTFVERVGWVFEHSPWVAERAWPHRPFATVVDLHTAMVREVGAADPDRQIALLRAHPDLGTRASMSDASVGEQSGAGLDRLSPAEFGRLQTLNAQYQQRNGFPFILAVRGASKTVVLEEIERRLRSTPEQERHEALRQVARIARFRLDDLLAPGA